MNATAETEVMAYHESGHAIAYDFFGHPIESLAMDRCVLPNEYQQRFNERQVAEMAQRETLLQHIICCCAGRAAKDRWYGYKAQSDENWKASSDYAQALSCALQLSDGDRTAARLLVDYALRRADLLVEKHWPQISRLAFALLEYNKIAGNDIRHFMKGSVLA
jgi:ATP-dependent Zn protease